MKATARKPRKYKKNRDRYLHIRTTDEVVNAVAKISETFGISNTEAIERAILIASSKL